VCVCVCLCVYVGNDQLVFPSLHLLLTKVSAKHKNYSCFTLDIANTRSHKLQLSPHGSEITFFCMYLAEQRRKLKLSKCLTKLLAMQYGGAKTNSTHS
jgi:hypothetical protein